MTLVYHALEYYKVHVCLGVLCVCVCVKSSRPRIYLNLRFWFFQHTENFELS